MEAKIQQYSDMLRELRSALSSGSVIGVDGPVEAGKSTLACKLSRDIGGVHVKLDYHLDPREELSYVERLALDEVGAVVRRAHQKGSPVLIDGLCLLSVLDRLGIKDCLMIHCYPFEKFSERLDFYDDENSPSPESLDPLDRQTMEYIKDKRPHMNARWTYMWVEWRKARGTHG